MKKLSDYRKHAAECRALAKQMLSGDQRDQLLAMAETWERLAEERETMMRINSEFGGEAPTDQAASSNPGHGIPG
jgi:hypothetical protein